jgi:hypothetical protein
MKIKIISDILEYDYCAKAVGETPIENDLYTYLKSMGIIKDNKIRKMDKFLKECKDWEVGFKKMIKRFKLKY